MKKFLLLVLMAVLATSVYALSEDEESVREFNVKEAGSNTKTAVKAEGPEEEVKLQKNIMSVGALEKAEGDKYTLRKVQSRLEFYLSEATRIFLRNGGKPGDLSEKKYICVRGPRNKKTILANSVYVFDSREQYEQMTEGEEQAGGGKKQFSSPLLGTVKRADPLVMALDDGREYQVSWDDDTYWVSNKQVTKDDLVPGDRIRLYFDRRISVRNKNTPVRIIIDKSKVEEQ